MNERIQELAAKANFGHMEKNEVVYDPRLEKFAELMIRDCAKIADIAEPYKSSDLIKNHFGVTE